MGEAFIDSYPDVIYLDGNSLGRLPSGTAEAVAQVVEREWGGELVEAWEHWIDVPRQIGDALATDLLGAPPGSVVVSDSTTVNFYKLVVAALDQHPERNVIVTDRTNFPTDRYVLQGLTAARGCEVRWLDTDLAQGPRPADVAAAVDVDTALVTLSHVDYRSAAIADMSAINTTAHAAGALVLWDLSHSAGAIPIELTADATDLAVGCTYKYLNGGPGSPAFLFVSPALQTGLTQPIWGWFGQQAQFAMGFDYDPARDIGRFQTGSPPVLGLAACAVGVRSITQIGIDVLRQRSIKLTERLIAEADVHLTPLGFTLGSPRNAAVRGGHVLLQHPDAFRISVAMRRFAKVIGDFRRPDGLRLAPVAAYVTEAQVVEAIQRIAVVVRTRRHENLEPSGARVT